MSTLTAGADLAWKVAASEATAGGHPLIENALLLVGILSLDAADATEPVIAAALRGFQAHEGLDLTGIADSTTTAKLVARHGS